MGGLRGVVCSCHTLNMAAPTKSPNPLRKSSLVRPFIFSPFNRANCFASSANSPSSCSAQNCCTSALLHSPVGFLGTKGVVPVLSGRTHDMSILTPAQCQEAPQGHGGHRNTKTTPQKQTHTYTSAAHTRSQGTNTGCGACCGCPTALQPAPAGSADRAHRHTQWCQSRPRHTPTVSAVQPACARTHSGKHTPHQHTRTHSVAAATWLRAPTTTRGFRTL